MASVVVHRYQKVSKQGVAISKAHIRYIQHRRGEDKEREPGTEGGRFRRELFSGDKDSIDRRELNDLIDREKQGGVAIHKLTLSPGVQGVDLKEYTREVMDALGREKGLDLQYGAAIHRNTDHDHVHVVVLGTDRNGHRVRINRDDHDLLRYEGDKYLEREHSYDRELDREARDIERFNQGRGEERTRDDERLGQLFGKRRDQEREIETHEDGREWSKERALEEMPDWQKIVVQEKTYTRYDSQEDLKGLNEHIKTHYEDRIEKREYAMLNRWIETKERHGDDCHERWDQQKFEKKEREDREGRDAHREFHELDKNARKFLERQEYVLNRHMPHQQRIFEERGRLSDFHCNYQNAMVKQDLMNARERSNDPELHKYVDSELQFLKEQQQEMSRDLPTVDLDTLYGKNNDRDRDSQNRDRESPSREPDRSVNLDEMKFSDPLKDKGHGDERAGTADQVIEPSQEQGRDDQANQPQLVQEPSRDLTDAQHGQDMHERSTFKSKLDEREEEREQPERER